MQELAPVVADHCSRTGSICSRDLRMAHLHAVKFLLRRDHAKYFDGTCREPSFGHGILELASTTEATWTWHKNQDSVAVASDTVRIRRNLQCTNQQERRR